MRRGRGSMSMASTTKTGRETIKAILTDIHFWIPALVLGLGIGLLVFLH